MSCIAMHGWSNVRVSNGDRPLIPFAYQQGQNFAILILWNFIKAR